MKREELIKLIRKVRKDKRKLEEQCLNRSLTSDEFYTLYTRLCAYEEYYIDILLEMNSDEHIDYIPFNHSSKENKIIFRLLRKNIALLCFYFSVKNKDDITSEIYKYAITLTEEEIGEPVGIIPNISRTIKHFKNSHIPLYNKDSFLEYYLNKEEELLNSYKKLKLQRPRKQAQKNKK